jgi:hypothetical protein
VQLRFARVIIDAKISDTMRNPFRTRPKPFLDAPRREWQFDAFAWLLRNCGGYPKFLDTTLVLPDDQCFPDRGMGGHAGAVALFRNVRDHAGMADWPCSVRPLTEESRAPGSGADRNRVIVYQPANDPSSLIAGFARELSRYLLDTFEEPPPGGVLLREPAIDLAAVFMGFGVFMANSAFETADYELNEGEFVHALAIFCLLRKLPLESADRHLNPHVRKYLRLATRDLAQHEKSFQRLRSVFALVPFDIADRTMPTRMP